MTIALLAVASACTSGGSAPEAHSASAPPPATDARPYELDRGILDLAGEWVFESSVGSGRDAVLTIEVGEWWHWNDSCNEYRLHGLGETEPAVSVTTVACDELDPRVTADADALRGRRLAVDRIADELVVRTDSGSVRFLSRDIVPLDDDLFAEALVSGLLGSGEADLGLPLFALAGHDASCPKAWGGEWPGPAAVNGRALHGVAAPMLAVQQRTAVLDAESLRASATLGDAIFAECRAERDDWTSVPLPDLSDFDAEVLVSYAAIREHFHAPDGAPTTEPRRRGTAFALIQQRGTLTALTGMFVDLDDPPQEWFDTVTRVVAHVERNLDAQQRRVTAEWDLVSRTLDVLPLTEDVAHRGKWVVEGTQDWERSATLVIGVETWTIDNGCNTHGPFHDGERWMMQSTLVGCRVGQAGYAAGFWLGWLAEGELEDEVLVVTADRTDPDSPTFRLRRP